MKPNTYSLLFAQALQRRSGILLFCAPSAASEVRLTHWFHLATKWRSELPTHSFPHFILASKSLGTHLDVNKFIKCNHIRCNSTLYHKFTLLSHGCLTLALSLKSSLLQSSLLLLLLLFRIVLRFICICRRA